VNSLVVWDFPPPCSAEFSNSAAVLYREFATRIVAKRQNIASKTDVSKRWELQIPISFLSRIANSAERLGLQANRGRMVNFGFT